MPVSVPDHSFAKRLYWPKRKPISRPPTPMSPAGMSVEGPPEFRHEAVAEAHHLIVALALGVEVRTALAPAHGESCEGVLEDLFEAQELEHREGDGRMEAEASFVRPDRVVELHPVALVHVDFSGVVLPCYSEGDRSIGLGDPLQNLGALVVVVVGHERVYGVDDLPCRLVKFRLVGISLFQARHEVIDLARERFGHVHLDCGAARPLGWCS